MKSKLHLAVCLLLISVVTASGVWLWFRDAARRDATSAATALAQALTSGNSQVIGQYLVSPPHLAEANPAERQRLVLDLLESEISPEGLAVLLEEGQFGPLRDVFPSQADAWTRPYDLAPEECVAFRLQRGSLTAELVLHRQPDSTYRVLRCNDIRQLANPPSQP